jgi:hypothetical protein
VLRCDNEEGTIINGENFDLDGLEIELDAENVDNFLFFFFGGSAWDNVFQPCSLDRASL